MEKIFLQMINMSYLGSIVILIILVTRFLLRRTPKKYSYLLWSIPLIRLALPISFKSPMSLMPSNSTPFTSDAIFSSLPVMETGTQSFDQIINHPVSNGGFAESASRIQVLITLGTFIWILGMSLFFVFAVISFIRLHNQLKESDHIRNNIFANDSIRTPFVIGLYKPKIYLPNFVSGEEMRYILLHEETHIKRHDHILRVLSYLVLMVHWFNPFVWLAYYYSGQDMEMSCDEAVITKLGNGIKKDYAQSLLNYTTGTRSFRMAPLAFGEGDTKGRIKNVLNFRQPKLYVFILSIIAIILISIALLSDPSKEAQNLKAISLKDAAEATDQIEVEVLSGETVSGGIEYDVLISNNGSYIIYDLRLALSHPVKITSGYMSNKNEIEAAMKLNQLKSGSSEIMKVLVPSTYSSQDKLDSHILEANLEGYLNVISEKSRFTKYGPVGFNEAYKPQEQGERIITDQTTIGLITPELSLDLNLGAIMPELDYASDDIVIFHGYFGLFVYDLKISQIIRGIDLRPLGFYQAQGSDYCEVSVSLDGKTVYLHPIESENMYIYNVSEHSMKVGPYEEMEEPFLSVPTEDALGYPLSGIYSDDAARFGKDEYGYLSTTDWSLGTLTYVRDDMVYSLFGLVD